MSIKISNIEKSFGKHEVLKGIDCEFYPGQVYAILGPNGSGKSTLMKSMLGLVKPNSGSIEIMGSDSLTNFEHRSRIGYAPQIARFPENLTVRDVIKLVTTIRKKPSYPQEFIDLFEIDHFLDQRLKNLSGGTRQKVNLVLALMFRPDILILDEPTSGLDPINRIKLKELLLKLRSEGKIIVVTTHILHLAEELADNILFLLEGKIKYHGATSKLLDLAKSTNLEKAIAGLLKGEVNVDGETTPIVNIFKGQKNA